MSRTLSLVKTALDTWLHNRAVALWTIAVATVAVRLGVAVALKTYEFSPARDYWKFGFEWGRIARWLVEAQMYSLDGKIPTSVTDPLYAFIIAGFFHVFGPFTTAAAVSLILFQILMYGIAAVLIFLVTERIYGPGQARIAALLFAFYPAGVFFATIRIDPSSVYVPLLSLAFLSCLSFQDSKRLKLIGLAGALMGLVILTTSKPLSLLLIVPFWLFLTAGKRGRGEALLPSALFVGLAVLVMLPWSIRNSIVVDELTISKSNLGYHVWAGNNPHATGFTDKIDAEHNPIAKAIHWNPQLPRWLVEEGHTSEYLALAGSWIRDNPRDFLLLTLRRIRYFWFYIPQPGTTKTEILNGWLMLVLAALGLAGAFWSRDPETFRKASLIIFYVALFPVLFYLTHVVYYRHRFHIEPFVLILASHGCIRAWELLRAKSPVSAWQKSLAARPPDPKSI